MSRTACLAILGVFLLFSACEQVKTSSIGLDIQGHRGARGYLPENTIPAFKLALESGVQTLEMDVVVSADGKLVVSHEPWMSAAICSHPGGAPVTIEQDLGLNLYRMTYDEIRQYDCGSRGNARFPQQKPMAAVKPLLAEVLDTMEAIGKAKNRTVLYNIETKSEPGLDNISQPAPAEFTKLLLDELKKHGVAERTTVQSFDVRTLQEMRKLDGKIKLALLAGEGTLAENLAALGFTPEIYSPDYKLVTEVLMEEAHEKGMQVIPWTVNDSLEMKRMIGLGVDGIITDYPDVCVKIATNYEGKGKGQRQTVQ